MAIEYKGDRHISKKNYKEYDKHVKELVSEDIYLQIMQKFKEDFKFDPSISASSPEKNEQKTAKREELKKQGISTYISAGVKKGYEKKKGILEGN